MTHNLQLTTEHSTSSYGIPVLVDENGNAYGPRDIVNGVEAWTLVTADPSPLAEAFIRSANLQPHEIDQTRQPKWDMTCPQCGRRHSDLLPCDDGEEVHQ